MPCYCDLHGYVRECDVMPLYDRGRLVPGEGPRVCCECGSVLVSGPSQTWASFLARLDRAAAQRELRQTANGYDRTDNLNGLYEDWQLER